jgi:hypothetical protein
MESIFIVTLWSGGRATKKWKTLERPELLPNGTGVKFTSLDTRLLVEVIGSISVEEYEQGSMELAEGAEPLAEEDEDDEEAPFDPARLN